MRVLIQGGVWKNTEDEILKAAVMKYGKNQWSRISSLLVRKSAKQCKARWYEWLDPSIKKTEWTREEDEKLLHLAKLMPCQWRTLAPIVGRTPAQCLERYEKLLDAASAKSGQYDQSDDPRRLRPGEIDPNPESKPARPDPVDMDEDEKEMLSEARARLANTKGKKAKRKAREKQLEAARRLASLQKRREMRAAGLAAFKRYTKKKHIDYATEIPFQQAPAPGFYDTTGENPTPDNREFLGKTIEQIEGKRRTDVEAQKRRADLQKSKLLKRHNLPLALEQTEKLNDPEQIRKRSRLNLPAPQVSDQELAEIAKMGNNAMDITDQGSAATQSLLSNYDQTPSATLRTPMRTPSASVDNIMAEAENLVKLQNLQTPLLGGENPDLHASDFTGITPKRNIVQTPNPLLTPARTPGGTSIEGSATPMSVRGGAVGSTPLRTPLRDELNINEEDSWMSENNGLSEKQRAKELKKGIRQGFSSLPAPKNEYQIMVPELEEEKPSEDAIEEDMADILQRRKEIEDEKIAAEMRKRSKSVQKDLPRPLSVRGIDIKPRPYGDSQTLRAERLIMDEMMQLLEHDCIKYPVKERKDDKKRKLVPEIQVFEESEIQRASSMVQEEVGRSATLTAYMNSSAQSPWLLFHSFSQLQPPQPVDQLPYTLEKCKIEQMEKDGPEPKYSAEDFEAAFESFGKSMIYLQSRQGYGLSEGSSMSDRLSYYQKAFDTLKEAMDKDKKRTSKLEAKLEVLTSGYVTRSQKMQKELEQIYDSVVNKVREHQSFEELEEMEKDAIHFRVDALRRLTHEQEEHEKTLQEKYSMLEKRRNELRALAT